MAFSLTLSTVYTAKISELRAFVRQNHIGVFGDKRRKATFIPAIVSFLEYQQKAAVKTAQLNDIAADMAKAAAAAETIEELIDAAIRNARQLKAFDFGYCFNPETKMWVHEDGNQLNEHDYDLMVEMAYAEGLV